MVTFRLDMIVETATAPPTRMQPAVIIAMLAILPFLFGGCCSDVQPRFWKVRDAASGGTAYTVDTAAVPATSLLPSDLRYVNAAGQYVTVASPKLVREISEQEWQDATSGAGYRLFYCGRRKACWAKARIH
jgi:hypothetical protein